MNKYNIYLKKNIYCAFSFSLPYELRLQTRHYYFATNKIIYKNLSKRLRRVVVSLKNESVGGKHFIIPSIYDCSHICFLFKKQKIKN